MNSLKRCFLAFSCLCLISCGKQLPPKLKQVEGIWRNEEVYLQISREGDFHYKRKSKGESVEINTWITEYTDTSFTASIIFSETVFQLNKAPYYDTTTHQMQMIVDGRVLVKQGEGEWE
jgi:hypothetical protein